ncbi:MAG: hypothetical protein HOV81_20765 [Kofleriaceae bacterium]|nr:hypothetical protein [Kofleriaceae bacterium]
MPPKPACIRPPEETGTINSATGDSSRVSYCVGTAVDQCFSLDLATGALKAIDKPPEPQSRSQGAVGRIETTNPELKVCSGEACKTLTPQVWPGAAPLRAATNGAIAAVMLGDATAGKGYVDVYDVAKAKRLATFRYARGDFKCGEIAMLGNTIYVEQNVCEAPSGRAALYSIKGKKIANVGGRADFGTFGGAFTQLDDKSWAFLGENGNKLVIQDVASGKVTKRIDTSMLFTTVAAANMGNPGESALVRLGSGKLAVIGGTPANGSVAIVDLETGDVKVIRAALCNEAS